MVTQTMLGSLGLQHSKTPELDGNAMTEDEMHEVYTVVEALGITRRQKQLAMNRLIERGVIEQPEPKRAVVTQSALDALGKMRVQW